MQSIILLLLIFFGFFQRAEAQIKVNRINPSPNQPEEVVITGLNPSETYSIEFQNARPFKTVTANECGIIKIKYNLDLPSDSGVYLSDGYQYYSLSINADYPRCIRGELDANSRRLIDEQILNGWDGSWFVWQIKNTIFVWVDSSVYPENRPFRQYGVQYLGNWGGDWHEDSWSGVVDDKKFKTNACGHLSVKKRGRFIDNFSFNYPDYWITDQFTYKIKQNNLVIHTFSGNLQNKPKPICRRGVEYFPDNW